MHTGSTIVLTAQQAAAKMAAHAMFDYPARLKAHKQGYEPDDLPRFKRGIAGIGIAADVLRIYVVPEVKPQSEAPEQIEGMRTEIIHTTGFKAFTLARQTELSPVPCGVSVGHHNITAGTLGCLVEVPGGQRMLSNNHVLADSNSGKPGDKILQPGASDGGTRSIGELEDFEPLVFGGAPNHIDAAIATLFDAPGATSRIMALGKHANPPVSAALDQDVAKHGRTTGLTFGKVVDLSFDGNVSYNGKVAYFENQIAIVGNSGAFSDGGDSGSLVVDTPGGHPVGLLFAGDSLHTLANPIELVLNRFGATVVAA